MDSDLALFQHCSAMKLILRSLMNAFAFLGSQVDLNGLAENFSYVMWNVVKYNIVFVDNR